MQSRELQLGGSKFPRSSELSRSKFRWSFGTHSDMAMREHRPVPSHGGTFISRYEVGVRREMSRLGLIRAMEDDKTTASLESGDGAEASQQVTTLQLLLLQISPSCCCRVRPFLPCLRGQQHGRCDQPTDFQDQHPSAPAHRTFLVQ